MERVVGKIDKSFDRAFGAPVKWIVLRLALTYSLCSRPAFADAHPESVVKLLQVFQAKGD